MGESDNKKNFAGLNTAAPPIQVVNAVPLNYPPGEHSYSQMVGQAAKGLTYAEVNFVRDLDKWASYLFHRWQVHSGWLKGQNRRDGYEDYTTVTAPGGLVDDSASGLLIDGTTLVNSFVLPRLEASVAGYPIVVEYTNTRTDGYNLVELEEATVFSGSGTIKRTDFVFLEVWQALIAPNPITTNKPANNLVYRHGNVLSPSVVGLPDDLIDPSLTVETSQRVQIQYRIRSTGVVEGVNYKTNPDGFSSSAALTAWAGAPSAVVGYPFVRADPSLPSWLNSDPSAYDYEDSGLWIAGKGDNTSTQALGAVNGFVYAIPICFVHRHNNCSDSAPGSLGFDPVNNTNGGPLHDHGGYAGVLGTILAGLSDRPDDEFADVITQNQLLDLRRHILFQGQDMAAEAQYQIQSLLDGSLRTWSVDAADKLSVMGSGSGDVSTRFLVCNEIGRTQAHGGPPPSNRGEEIREFDHVCRRFGDQSVIERVVFAFYPGDRQAGAVPPGIDNPGKYVVKAGTPAPNWQTTWYEGDVLNLNLAQFDPTTLGGIFQGLSGGGPSGSVPVMSVMMPAGTVITDVLSVEHDDGNYGAAVLQSTQVTLVQGLGTRHLELTLDANDTAVTGGLPVAPYRMAGSGGTADGSPRRIFVEVEITYPIGAGTTDTPDHPVLPDSVVYNGVFAGPEAVIETDTTQRPSDFEVLLPPQFRSGYREVGLEYVANDSTSHVGWPGVEYNIPVGGVTTETLVSASPFDLVFPRRVFDPGAGPLSGVTLALDQVDALPRTIDPITSEFGSSSRHMLIDSAGPNFPLSGAGQTLCAIVYFAQDPIPNYGASGSGYEVGVYYRTNAPQTAGTKDGVIDTSAEGTMPQTLVLEPLFYSKTLWTGQVGMGSVDQAFPYSAPLDQIATNDGTLPSTFEWFFSATASTTIDDFNADTGLLTLHSFVQADGQEHLQLGGAASHQSPRQDAEFRAYYPFAEDTAYRPTILSQPLFGAVRHKVFVPMLARATEAVEGSSGGVLYRKDELLLVVFSRFAQLDEDNNVRFVDPPTSNTTGAAVYRTRNLLLMVGR